MGIYQELGVRTVINAAGCVTRYGGSLVAPEVMELMSEASQEFCILDELHDKVGKKIAAMLDVEAAYVTASAASGMTPQTQNRMDAFIRPSRRPGVTRWRDVTCVML